MFRRPIGKIHEQGFDNLGINLMHIKSFKSS